MGRWICTHWPVGDGLTPVRAEEFECGCPAGARVRFVLAWAAWIALLWALALWRG